MLCTTVAANPNFDLFISMTHHDLSHSGQLQANAVHNLAFDFVTHRDLSH